MTEYESRSHAAVASFQFESTSNNRFRPHQGTAIRCSVKQVDLTCLDGLWLKQLQNFLRQMRNQARWPHHFHDELCIDKTNSYLLANIHWPGNRVTRISREPYSMNRYAIIRLILVALIFFGLAMVRRWSPINRVFNEFAPVSMGESYSPFDTIKYRGQTIKLKRPYSDYEEYEDDDDNIDPSDIPKVQQLVETAPIARQFSDAKKMTLAVAFLKFPGWGWSMLGTRRQSDGSTLNLYGIVVPYANKHRYLLFRGVGSTFTLIDDFVHTDSERIENVTVAGDKIQYFVENSPAVLERVSSVK